MRLEVIRRISRKELTLFFASPIGYLFLLSFLAVTLFIFFWGEAFFARNIADVRPMFEWLPVLLIFLSSALTMRMWSEERRTGTLEFVATLPASGWEFVLGKFLACWTLLGVALLLTLPLPLSVAFMADLDWGPVLAGYIAALLLGGAYLAIGVFVSARTDSQIVSLIVASSVCGLFYLIGTPLLTDLVGGQSADLMRSVGSGSRFSSITRGVLDFRDLYFYVSLAAVFLTLNVYALETRRWAVDGDRDHHRKWRLATSLLAANLLLANLWLAPLGNLRIDMTEGRLYSISEATRGYLAQLTEPMLIRGYFSKKTHPLLAPLVPQMRDLLNEFAVAGGDRLRVEIVDPAEDPAIEDEANMKYGIQPVPFQVADRYQASLINSYFDVLISYGDEYEVLSFRDFIEVKVVGEAQLDVQLRNPEFDLTRAIKKVLYGFQGGGDIFDSIKQPVRFVGYVSADERLPEALVDYRSVLTEALEELVAQSSGLLSAELLDPDAGDAALALEIAQEYGLQPMAAGLFDLNTFYFYLTLTDGATVVQIPLPTALSVEATTRGIREGLKRYAAGLLKTVALMVPEPAPPAYGGQGAMGNRFRQLQDFLQADFNVTTTRLAEGRVPETADLLMVIDPESLSETQVFAIDQFLMQGGTVVVATSPYSARLTQRALMAAPRTSGLEDWLAHHGISMTRSFVMDPQNAAFPAPVTRQVGGFSFQELVMLDYPYFIDIRPDGINQDISLTAGLPQITMTWSSPIVVAEEANANRQVTTLLSSTPGSWLSSDTDIMPRLDDQGLSGFVPAAELASAKLAVLIEGRFESFYAGQRSPLLEQLQGSDEVTPTSEAEDTADESQTDTLGVVSGVIERSPESARLIVFSSNNFLADQILRMVGSAEGIIYTNSVQMMANVVDWTVEDRSLLAIRARGHFNRTLPPMQFELFGSTLSNAASQAVVEYLNYAFAVIGIFVVFLIHRRRMTSLRTEYSAWLAGGEA